MNSSLSCSLQIYFGKSSQKITETLQTTPLPSGYSCWCSEGSQANKDLSFPAKKKSSFYVIIYSSESETFDFQQGVGAL